MDKPFSIPASCWRCAASALLSLAASACASEAKPPPPVATASSTTLQQIKAEIGDAACSSQQQCRTLAIGAKACGGPEAYLAWSTQRSDPAKLAALAAQHKTQREAENARSGQMSDCRFVTDPGAQCRAGHCQLGGDNGAALQR